MKISIIHLDLGIGGAEKLVVNVASALLEMGHDIKIYTSHHDKNRCFEETSVTGKLYPSIRVLGSWLPREIFGKCTALCAILRMLYMSLAIIISREKTDLIFIDGVSAPIPLLHFSKLPVLFYCHFPDKLLCVQRESSLKRMYRYFIDSVEECTTGLADTIVVNSNYTASMFKSAFSTLSNLYTPNVLYPTITMPVINKTAHPLEYIANYQFIFSSLNRYERKKNILLALESFKMLLASECVNERRNKSSILLVIAGGYDDRVEENVSYFHELYKFAESNNLLSNVVFRKSISDQERNSLLLATTAVLYTPANEHFGIVPIEALSFGTPVIAVNSGGPLETIMDGKTGFLCEQTPLAFSNAMSVFIKDSNIKKVFGDCGKKYVEDNFTNDALKKRLDVCINDCVKCHSHKHITFYERLYLRYFLVHVVAVMSLVVAIFYKYF